jgi:hypothetical protein
MTWRRSKSAIAAIGFDGTVYKVKIAEDQVVVTTSGPSATEVQQDEGMPWLSEDEAKAWCDEHDAWRDQ